MSTSAAIVMLHDRGAALCVERARLRGSMLALLETGGMSGLKAAIETELASLAADYRDLISKEGWVA